MRKCIQCSRQSGKYLITIHTFRVLHLHLAFLLTYAKSFAKWIPYHFAYYRDIFSIQDFRKLCTDGCWQRRVRTIAPHTQLQCLPTQRWHWI